MFVIPKRSLTGYLERRKVYACQVKKNMAHNLTYGHPDRKSAKNMPISNLQIMLRCTMHHVKSVSPWHSNIKGTIKRSAIFGSSIAIAIFFSRSPFGQKIAGRSRSRNSMIAIAKTRSRSF